MAGKHTSGMLLLDFSSNSLVLDCGRAHVRQPYTVENAPSALLIHVNNSGGPFTLTLQPDNTLRGAGSTTVNGRLVTGMNGDNVAFAAQSERCDVGTFSPGSSASPPASTSSSPPANRTDAAAPDISLAIASSFPIAANPLAGRVVQLMSVRFDDAMRKAGAPVPADVTPGQALQAYVTKCPPPSGCPAAARLLHPYYVGKATFDSTGKATVTASVPPGTYYVFCAAKGSNGALVWDLPITLKPGGANAITLTASNAELVH